jgi:uncharacterized protein (TIGR03000 family)
MGLQTSPPEFQKLEAEFKKNLQLMPSGFDNLDTPQYKIMAKLPSIQQGVIRNKTRQVYQLYDISIPEGQPRRYAYLGCKGDHHLAGETGTGLYYWHHKQYLVNLLFQEKDENYYYYVEKENPEFQWAFSRKSECGCLYPVWILPGAESNGDWVFYQYAYRKRPANANPKPGRQVYAEKTSSADANATLASTISMDGSRSGRPPTSTGKNRKYLTPPLKSGMLYSYSLRALLDVDGKIHAMVRRVEFLAGETR